MRVALAAVLFSEPDILLLDEPTNYLDLEGVLWLTDYLKTCPSTILVISHDRDLLDDVADHILHLDRGQAHALERRLHELRAPAPRAAGPSGQDAEEAGGAARPSAGLRRPLPRQRDQGDAGPVAPQDAGQDGADRGGRRRGRSLPFKWPPVARKLSPPIVTMEKVSAGYGEPRGAVAHRSHALQRRPDRPARAPTATASRPSPS